VSLVYAVGQLTPLTWHNLFNTIEGIVAVATFTLAAVTVVLAWRTSVMASKTADLAEFTKEDVALARTAVEADVPVTF
jgi:hypothetical protein